MTLRRRTRDVRGKYRALRKRLRPGKCEWVLHRMFGPPGWLPKPVRLSLFRLWPLTTRIIWCNNPATITATSPIAVYDGIRVCDKHLEDVELANHLDEMIKSGELDRQMREAGDQ